jgi:drug/metabolite transporter (DMT)-like permease
LGIFCACVIVMIWSTWLVAARAGALSPITTYDMAALRYGVSSIVALPFLLYFKPWKTLSVKRIAVLAFLLSPVYILLVFGGFNFAPAAHGGIFMNGGLPVITLALGWFLLKERATSFQLACAVLILFGTVLVVADTSHFSFRESWLGDLMFVGGGIFFAIYMVINRRWQLKNIHVVLCGTIVNAVFYIPVWYFFLPKGFHEATQAQILVQTFYQGIVPNLIGLLMVATAVRHIGSTATSAFMAGVPGLGALLGFLVLGEAMGWIGWTAITILTIGILLMNYAGQRKSS